MNISLIVISIWLWVFNWHILFLLEKINALLSQWHKPEIFCNLTTSDLSLYWRSVVKNLLNTVILATISYIRQSEKDSSGTDMYGGPVEPQQICTVK